MVRATSRGTAAHASRISGPEPARLAQHSPRPLKSGFLRDGGRAVLRAGNEIERGADAQACRFHPIRRGTAPQTVLGAARRGRRSKVWRRRRECFRSHGRLPRNKDRTPGRARRHPAICNPLNRSRQTPGAVSRASARSNQDRNTGVPFFGFPHRPVRQIGAGRSFDWYAHEPAQHDDREPSAVTNRARR